MNHPKREIVQAMQWFNVPFLNDLLSRLYMVSSGEFYQLVEWGGLPSVYWDLNSMRKSSDVGVEI